MLKVTVKEYVESNDTFVCECDDTLSPAKQDVVIPAFVLAYLAPSLCEPAYTDDDFDPHGLISLSCEIAHPFFDA